MLPDTETTALALPGFASEVPAGFTATKEAYLEWIIARLEALGEPVDLVGHDWGCILTARVASVRPDLVKSWVGISGPVHPDYEWHDFAKIWQTPGEGVQYIDAPMKDCILKLYRSAVHVGRDWAPGLKGVTAPSLVIWGLNDGFLPHVFADRLGEATHAQAVLKLDAAHWPLLQRPDVVAQQLLAHWARVG